MSSNDKNFGNDAPARYQAAVERFMVEEWERKYGE